MNIKWTPDELEFVKKNADKMTDKKLAFELNKITDKKFTMQAVRKKRQKLGITKKQGRGVCQVVRQATEIGRVVVRSQ